MMQSNSLVAVTLKHAILIGLVSLVWGIITYVSGLFTQQWVGYVSYLILLVGIVLAMKEWRDRVQKGVLSFGNAFKVGMLFCLWSALISVLSMVFMLYVLAPEMIQEILKASEQQMLDRGLSDQEIEVAMTWTRRFVTPGWLTFFSFVGTLFFGMLLSLVAALFMKKEPKELQV